MYFNGFGSSCYVVQDGKRCSCIYCILWQSLSDRHSFLFSCFTGLGFSDIIYYVAWRTFVTMSLRKGMLPEDIRAVTVHTTIKYVKFDYESKREKMSILNEARQQGRETVFDYEISSDERMKLGISEQ